MSDADLRELERRWKETGSVEDEAACLRARVQTGELYEDKLEFAAYCGHEGARLALDVGAKVSPSSFLEWLRGLEDKVSSQDAWPANARAYVALHSPVLDWWVEAGDAELAEDLSSSVAAIELWLATPSSPALAEARDRHGDMWEISDFDGTANSAWMVLAEGSPVTEEQARDAVQAALIPWALGYSDPVRERVEARRRANAEPHS